MYNLKKLIKIAPHSKLRAKVLKNTEDRPLE